MSESKIRLLFNGYALLDSMRKNLARTGIYMTAFNILRQMTKDARFEIVLFAQSAKDMEKYLERYFPGERDMEVITNLRQIRDVDAWLSPLHSMGNQVKRHCPGIFSSSIVYDIIPVFYPEYYSDEENARIWRLLDHAGGDDRLFAISHCTKKDVVAMGTGIAPEAVTVIPLGANEHFYHNPDPVLAAKVRAKYNIPPGKDYILSLCTKEPRKNLLNAIRSFVAFVDSEKADNLVFVLAGGTWDIFKDEYARCVGDLGRHAESVVNIGYVDDGDLAPLYSNALWFVYTSRYEGFGLPPLEAMQCGCPVVTSRRSSLPEVVGDAALQVDSDDIAEHVAAFEKYYRDPQLREEYRRKGLERAKLFSWEKCAKIIGDTICAEVEKKRRTPQALLLVTANSSADGASLPELRHCMESALAQDYANKTILVLDGGNDPEHSAVLRRYAASARDVTVESVPETELSQAVAKTLDRCVGDEHVMFLTAKAGFPTRDLLSVLVAKSMEAEADLAFCDKIGVGRSGEVVGAGGVERLPFGDHGLLGISLLRAAAVRRAGGWDAAWGAVAFDEMVMRMARSGMKFTRVRLLRMHGGERRFFTAGDERALYGKAFHRVFGEQYGLSMREADCLSGDRFLKCMSNDGILKLAGKLPMERGCREMLLRAARMRGAEQAFKDDSTGGPNLKHKLLGVFPCTCRQSGDEHESNVFYHLWGLVPLLKVKRRGQTRTSYYLFNVLPLWRTIRQ